MSKYFIRRLLISIPALLGISLVLFTILAMAPGDPFEELATNPNVPPEVRANLRTQFGLDDPIPIRYVRWITAMVKGDWGFSFASRVNVSTLIMQRLPTTLFVLGTAQLLAILVALPIGVYSAVRPYSIFDQIATSFAFIGFSLPTFFTGLLLIIVFSVRLGWLPMIYDRCVKTGRGADWEDPEWKMLDMGGYGCGARWFLDHAITHRKMELARWCLEHGASADPPPAVDKRFAQHTVYESAVLAGENEIAELLLRHGARATAIAEP